MTGVTIADFLKAGADDLWDRLGKLGEITEHDDKQYWTDERDLLRETVRLLKRCDDELTFKLTGERVLYGRFYDQERIKAEQLRAGEYDEFTRAQIRRELEVNAEIDETIMRHPASAENFHRWMDPLDHDQAEPFESEQERYWRERDDRNGL